MRRSAGTGLLILVFMSGCCLFKEPPPPPPENSTRVNLKASSTVAFKDVWVHQEGNALVLEGGLHPRSFIQKDAGHVDVRIVDADGHLLHELKVSPKETVFSKENGRISPFTCSVDLVAGPDTTVFLQAHDGRVENCE